ncbi:MAG: DUF2019 domain-containing protein [Myxococcota bacterium]|jgi:hypothetical protein|nr:DUF2019 domain-containing protein [Myxococcota bacterium]
MKRIEALVQRFADNVAAQSEALLRGDARAGNKHAKQYIAAFKALRAIGDEGREALVPLMFEGRDDIRLMASAFLLRFRHEDARRVLEGLARGTGMTAFSAGEALKRWDERTWQLDPE